MTYTESLTQSYTIADIGKVIDCFAADLDMTSQSTALLNRDLVKQYAADVKSMAQRGYLLEANIVLKDSSGNVIRAAKYEVNTDAASLTASRPGNNRWPVTPGGELSVVVRNSQKWRDLTDAQRTAFNATLSPSWGSSNVDLSFPALTRGSDRNYVSNGWGVTKSIYQ
ncbi:MAG: hypothetical protein M3Y72_00130 [Acidobacteriota bacterium]|nr:hypothetical protein [Acidobacteriota bacterium]